ncbi:MAG: ROK family protein [archaeon]
MTLSIDIGGTHIRSALVSKTNLSQIIKTHTPKTKKQIINSLFKTISSYPKQNSIHISTAGFERNGLIHHAINMDFKVPLRKILKQKFKVPVYVENDANCAALAELNYGNGKKLNNFILLTLGTGIGGAIVINRKIYKGNGGAGEIGCMIIDKGKIYEHLASGSASVKLAHKRGLKINYHELNALADKGNKKAKAVYNEIGHYLGIGLANLAYIFDPDAIILGGGFSKVRHIYPQAKATLNKLYILNPKPKILKAKLEDNAGMIGATLLKT